MTRRVVISGLGTVGSYGCGAERLSAALRSGIPALSPVRRVGGYHLPESARSAALVTADLSSWVKPAAARRMSAPSKFAVAAARMALEDARLTESGDVWDDTAIVMSTSFGPADFTERLFLAIQREGPETASPFHFTESVANAPAAQIAIECRARGSNITVVQREAGSLLAVAHATAEVSEGRAVRALAGTVDEMPPLLHAILDRLDALVRRAEPEPEMPRPLDRRRDGAVAAEGSTVLVIEPEDSAAERGARVLARIRAAGAGFDASASRVGWGRGEAVLAERLTAVLRRAALQPSDVDLIVSGASGARAGDRVEALTLKHAWNHVPLPPVLVPKGTTGEYGGGFLASAVWAAGGGEFGPCPGFRETDPELEIAPYAGGRLPRPQTMLVSSIAAGGAAAWLVLEAP